MDGSGISPRAILKRLDSVAVTKGWVGRDLYRYPRIRHLVFECVGLGRMNLSLLTYCMRRCRARSHLGVWDERRGIPSANLNWKLQIHSGKTCMHMCLVVMFLDLMEVWVVRS